MNCDHESDIRYGGKRIGPGESTTDYEMLCPNCHRKWVEENPREAAAKISGAELRLTHMLLDEWSTD